MIVKCQNAKYNEKKNQNKHNNQNTRSKYCLFVLNFFVFFGALQAITKNFTSFIEQFKPI